MEQIIKLTGRIAEVMPLQSGISQRTGNTWKSQEYLFEYFAWSGAQYPNRIVCRVFGEETIAKLSIKPMEENVTVTLSFNATKSQDGTRWFNEVRLQNIERHGQQGAAPVAQPTGQAATPAPNGTGTVAQPAQQQAAPFPPAVDANGQPTNEGGQTDDLPF